MPPLCSGTQRMSSSSTYNKTRSARSPRCRTLQVEDLKAIVLVVGYRQAAAPVIPDAVRQVELSWGLARLAPGGLVFAVRRELVHPGIDITVGYIHAALGSSTISVGVERAAADRRGILRRHAGVRPSALLADGADQLAPPAPLCALR